MLFRKQLKSRSDRETTKVSVSRLSVERKRINQSLFTKFRLVCLNFHFDSKFITLHNRTSVPFYYTVRKKTLKKISIKKITSKKTLSIIIYIFHVV